MKKKATVKKTSIKHNVENCDESFAFNDSNMILFNGKMRKVFVEGILQDVKGYFESKTDGKVEVSYEDYSLKTSEFGFKLFAKKTEKCKKQMWVEATSAIVNLMNYIFPFSSIDRASGSVKSLDVTIYSTNDMLEIELISCW